MQIIVTHRNMDFDALASQIAASKLYPEAVMVSAGGIPPAVKKFLTLFMDHFEPLPVKDLDISKVTRMVVVDVRSMSRLKDFKPLLNRITKGDKSIDVHIYDHHIAAPDDLPGKMVQVESVGSTTTLLVEHIQTRGISISAIEATALALGIYSDTGSLTYAITTTRDMDAVCFLLKHGANMLTIRYFLAAPMTTAQKLVFVKALSNITLHDFDGINIGILSVHLDKPILGLAQIVDKILMLGGYEGVFSLFENKNSVTIIGRSWLPTMDVGTVLQQIGGGGNQGAGSVRLKKTSLEEAGKQLLDTIAANPPRPKRVFSFMKFPVFSVDPDMILDEVLLAFIQRGISGAPVIKKGKITGIISKRDIRSAEYRKSTHLPVSSCMSHEVRTIHPQSPLIRAIEKMTEHNIGRLIVVNNEETVGIITRNDILKILYKYPG